MFTDTCIFYQFFLTRGSLLRCSQISDIWYTVENVENTSDSVNKAIKEFEFYPSILLTKNRIGENISQNWFCFNEVTKVNVLKDVNSINNKKATSFNKIPSKILKIPSNVLLTLYIASKWILSWKKCPSNHKLVGITPIYKKKDTLKSFLKVKAKVNQLLHYGLLIRIFLWLQTRFQHATYLNSNWSKVGAKA